MLGRYWNPLNLVLVVGIHKLDKIEACTAKYVFSPTVKSINKGKLAFFAPFFYRRKLFYDQMRENIIALQFAMFFDFS